MHVERWSILPGPDFAGARISLSMTGPNCSAPRIEDIGTLPVVGSGLQIRLFGPDRRVVFDGYVSRHLAGVGPDEEYLAIEAEEVLSARLNRLIAGRWQESADLVVFVPVGECVFNVEPDGLASENTHEVHSRSCRVFCSDAGGQLWSVADILNYILATTVPADIDALGLEGLADQAGTIYPPRFSLTGLPVREAITRTAAIAGLAVRSGSVSGNGRTSLVFYRPGRTGRRRAIRLQRAGETFDAGRSNLWKGGITFNRRPSRPTVSVIGGLKRYESTFMLQKGWDVDMESYQYRDFVRGDADDWPMKADVFRKWVLNESGRYCDEPYNLETFDFTDVSSEDFILTDARLFNPCLSVSSTGGSLGIVVEVSCDDGSTWRRYGGAVRVADDECAIYLADDALPADYFQAVAIDGTAKVRVTATVTSDRRINAEIPGDASCPAKIVRVSSAQWEKVHNDSIFYQCEDLPAPDERDDTGRLNQIAISLRETQSSAVEADMSLGWVDVACDVGDIIEQVEGRRLELNVFPDSTPHIRAVEHRCDEEWTTHLKVSG